MVHYFVFILYLSVRLSFCLNVYCVYELHDDDLTTNTRVTYAVLTYLHNIMVMTWVAVASAGPYANVHLDPDT